MTDDQQAIINSISREIARSATGAAIRQYNPSHDPDRDDDSITDRKKLMTELRAIRARLEDLFTGVL